MTQVYQVINIQQKPSKLNGGFYYLIKLQNITTLDILETSVDPAYKNFNNWKKVIQDQHRGQLLSNLNTATRGGKTIVNADSKPQQEAVCDPQQMNDILNEWRSPNKFQELFE